MINLKRMDSKKLFDLYTPDKTGDPDLYHTFEKRVPKLMIECTDHFKTIYNDYLKIKYDKESQLTDQQLIEAEKEANLIYQEMVAYSKEPATNSEISRIEDNYEDVDLWNRKLDDWMQTNDQIKPKYLNTPFIWSECYMYRRLISPFLKSKYFQDFDIFKKKKQDGFLITKEASTTLIELVAGISDRIKKQESTCDEEFELFLHFALWGNSFDLSGGILARMMKDFKLIDKTKKQDIFSDSTDEMYSYFKKSTSRNHQITLILDNAGFELLNDLCFIEMLYQTNLLDANSKVIFHCKKYSWFVSDAMERDFIWLLDCLANQFESDIVKSISKKWSTLLKNGHWELRTHTFWQTPYGFNRMIDHAPELYDELSRSDLLIICGDLNYRKTINDHISNYYEPFDKALGRFRPTNILVIRTIKSRPLVGLDKSVVIPVPVWTGKKWREKVYWKNCNGVIQFSKKL